MQLVAKHLFYCVYNRNLIVLYMILYDDMYQVHDDYTAVIVALACGTYSFTITFMFNGTSLLTDILEPEKQFVILRLPLFRGYFICIIICLNL